jgi:hypothetical protein
MVPNYVKTIICLANSRKISGRCVAGKEINGNGIGGWVRPVSARPTGELSEEERRFQDGQHPELLDVVHVPMVEPRPSGFQAENHLIDARYYWVKEREAAWAELEAAVDPVSPLWDNRSSTYNGLHDRVDEASANQLGSSLRLIAVNDFSVSVGIEGAAFGNAKRKVRGRFSLEDEEYRLAVTDPVVERQLLACPDGVFTVGNAILCISLGEPWDGYAYKLIAGIFVKP